MYRMRFRHWRIALVLALTWAIAGGINLSARAESPDLTGNGRPVNRDSAGSYLTPILSIEAEG